MVRSYCLAKRCPHLKKKTLFFPLYQVQNWCMKKNAELSKVPVCPLEIEKEKKEKKEKKG